MDGVQILTKDYIFTSEVSPNTDENEFIVEFYQNESDTESEPIKVIHNFDELISFFEEEF